MLLCQRHLGARRLVGSQSHRHGLALEAIADALHGVVSRRQVVHGETALRLGDDHERQASFRIDQFDIGPGERFPGCGLDHAGNAAGEVRRAHRLDAGQQRYGRGYG